MFGAIAVPIVLGLLRHKLGRGPLAAALLFGGTLFPALGFFNVYPMRFSFVADHFQYLASVPMIVLFCAAVYHVLGFASQKRVAAAAALVLLTVFGCLTWRQSQNYRGLEELWTHTTTKNPESWAAHLNLGDVYFRKQDYPKAANCYKKVLDLRPDEPKALYSYGWLLHRMDDSDGGRRYLNSALENLKKQRNAKPYQILYLLGRTWADESSPEKAAHYFQQAVDFADHTTKAGHPAAVLQRDKDALASIRNDLAWIRATNPSVRLRDGRQAVRLAQLACDHARNGDQYCFLLDTLAAAYAEAGKYDLAIKTAEEAIDLAKENKSAETTIAQMESRLRRYLQRQPYRH
ncbi:MAG: tetratricopeptide repeat protein [Pirellulales bacterium]